MVKIHNIDLEFLSLKTEMYLSNYVSNIDTINNIATIISKPIENIIPIYKTKNIILQQQKQVSQTIKQDQ